MKYYAVKKCNQTGIFTDWEQCKIATQGYSGAVYKSFKNEADAIAFMERDETKIEKTVGSCRCFVSVDCKDDVRCIGVAIDGLLISGADNTEYTFGVTDCTPNQALLLANCIAVRNAYRLGYKSVEVVCCNDTYKWLTGEWSPKDKEVILPLMQAVHSYMTTEGMTYSFRRPLDEVETGNITKVKGSAKWQRVSANSTSILNYIEFLKQS